MLTPETIVFKACCCPCVLFGEIVYRFDHPHDEELEGLEACNSNASSLHALDNTRADRLTPVFCMLLGHVVRRVSRLRTLCDQS